MKIVHIAITAPYIDGWGYQENVLPIYQVKQGNRVTIIASDIMPSYLKERRIKTGQYERDGLHIIRINCYKISDSMILNSPLLNILRNEKPDIIFHHNLNCTSLISVARYKKKNPGCIVFCDSHVDHINQTRNRFWRFIYYKLCIKGTLKIFKKYIDLFYGVSLSRCDYLQDVFGVPKEKIKFLPIGADTDLADKLPPKEELLRKYGFSNNDFILISGGKMGKKKGTDTLIKVIADLHRDKSDFKLVLFGSFEDKETERLLKNNDFICMKGWCDRQTTMELLKMASVAIWPIHHTTLVEDCIAVKTPLILRETRTTLHLIEGNGIFLSETTFEGLKKSILQMRKDLREYKANCQSMYEKLSYNKIVAQIMMDAKSKTN